MRSEVLRGRFTSRTSLHIGYMRRSEAGVHIVVSSTVTRFTNSVWLDASA